MYESLPAHPLAEALHSDGRNSVKNQFGTPLALQASSSNQPPRIFYLRRTDGRMDGWISRLINTASFRVYFTLLNTV